MNSKLDYCYIVLVIVVVVVVVVVEKETTVWKQCIIKQFCEVFSFPC